VLRAPVFFAFMDMVFRGPAGSQKSKTEDSSCKKAPLTIAAVRGDSDF
jgi:hypothetical protein